MLLTEGKVKFYVMDGEQKRYLYFKANNRFDFKCEWGETFQLKSGGLEGKEYHVNDIVAEGVEEGACLVLFLGFMSLFIHFLAPILFMIFGYLLSARQNQINQERADYFNANKL